MGETSKINSEIYWPLDRSSEFFSIKLTPNFFRISLRIPVKKITLRFYLKVPEDLMLEKISNSWGKFQWHQLREFQANFLRHKYQCYYHGRPNHKYPLHINNFQKASLPFVYHFTWSKELQKFNWLCCTPILNCSEHMQRKKVNFNLRIT